MSYPPYGAAGGYPPAVPGYPVILYIYITTTAVLNNLLFILIARVKTSGHETTLNSELVTGAVLVHNWWHQEDILPEFLP